MQFRLTQASQPSLLPPQDWQRERLTEYKRTDTTAPRREQIFEEFVAAFDGFLTAIATKQWEYCGHPKGQDGLSLLKDAAVKGLRAGLERWRTEFTYAPERLVARDAFYECRMMAHRLTGPRFRIIPGTYGAN